MSKSCGFYLFEMPQTEWLKTTEIYILILWNLEVQNQGVITAMVHLKFLGEDLESRLFLVSGGC